MIIYVILLFSHGDVLTQDIRADIDLKDFGTSFTPVNDIELIRTTLVKSLMVCASLCVQDATCRTFDYDKSFRQCRLFEGEIMTGIVNISSSSASKVGGIRYSPKLYVIYHQTCDKCAFNRYLLCNNNLCECPSHTFWDGEIVKIKCTQKVRVRLTAGVERNGILYAVPITHAR
ncbi:unnamed protein product, partial [Didymodactylos carnosus]